ncbi:hypothetical protein BC936DRAFT_139291 [Jimgerdemannia flammicorona]|uniref:Uncharacterized protein n=1 Tax=Jimgerdemannia flammicorona TaxID=994334 RepID=A0A433DHV9_9FUNG|nr:hypothetical protein BC936DRAFT_139291 [Jimgerdemannia flammicorona]
MSQAVGNTALAYARVWHLVDARQRILGRMATGVATTLMGKHKPIYDPACEYAFLFAPSVYATPGSANVKFRGLIYLLPRHSRLRRLCRRYQRQARRCYGPKSRAEALSPSHGLSRRAERDPIQAVDGAGSRIGMCCRSRSYVLRIPEGRTLMKHGPNDGLNELTSLFQIIRKAVSGMLPKNRLREPRLDRLLIFADDKHPYADNIIKRYDEEPEEAPAGKTVRPKSGGVGAR